MGLWAVNLDTLAFRLKVLCVYVCMYIYNMSIYTDRGFKDSAGFSTAQVEIGCRVLASSKHPKH